MSRPSFADLEPPVVVAHRGASSTHPENTLPSFEEALRLGAPVVELDVRLTADAVPVVMHDPDVDRTTDGTGPVHELTLERIRALDAGTPGSPARVPTLDEVLELVSGRAGVALEIKNVPGEAAFEPDAESIVWATLDAVERLGFDGPVLVLSFNPRSLAAASARGTDVTTGFLVSDRMPADEAVALCHEAGHPLVLPSARAVSTAGASLVERVHGAGLRLGTWTVDDEETFSRMAAWGVDAIATNDPAMGLRSAASRRSRRG
jgi:glycerophosphoryl diester phosphodiesterase